MLIGFMAQQPFMGYLVTNYSRQWKHSHHKDKN